MSIQVLTFSGATCIRPKHDTSTELNTKTVKVSVGQSDLSKLSSADYLGVKKLIVHPEWNFTTQNYDADVALVVLELNLVFFHEVQPACLPKDNSIASLTDGYIVSCKKVHCALRK